MASTNSLLVKREGGILIATLNCPDKMNAINKDFLEDLKELIDVLDTDKTVRVVILTASGDKAFCVGADLKERQGMNEKDILVRMEYVRTLYPRMEKLSVPFIAAINGMALGGGLELALACDFRVASETATMGFPEVDLAIIPGNGGTQRLPRIVGLSKALELILLAKRLTAKEALELGLVNAVVPAGRQLNQAMEWAAKIQEAGPKGIHMAKIAIRGGMERSFEHGLQHEVECYKSVLYSKDRLEGLKAFAEKRKPVYKGE
jgi:methylglutaconyl-CoA hydratase